MAGAGIRIDYDDRDVGQALRRLIGTLADPKPALDEIGRKLVTSTSFRFEHGAGPSGAPWKPSLRAKREGGQTLINDGHLRDSITHNVLPGDVLEVGSTSKYAAIHQFGGRIQAKSARALRFPIGDGFVVVKAVTIPARPFLGLNAGDVSAIDAVVTRHLAEAVS